MSGQSNSADMSSDQDKNPNNISSWKKAVTKEPEIHISPDLLALGNLISWQSGSSITMPQYLHLRVLWKIHKNTDFKLQKYVGSSAIMQANKLSTTRLCAEFCKETRDPLPPTKSHNELSMFSLVRFYMDLVRGIDEYEAATNSVEKVFMGRITRSQAAQQAKAVVSDSQPGRPGTPPRDSRTGSSGSPGPPQASKDKGKGIEMLSTPQNMRIATPSGDSPAQAKDFTGRQDENIVNMQILLLLNALTEREGGIRGKRYHWVPERAGFAINDNRDQSQITDPKKEKILQALVDGLLKDPEGEAAALIEVKPCARMAKLRQIQWQESAQMCAHICDVLRKEKQGKIRTPEFGLLKCEVPGRKRQVTTSTTKYGIWTDMTSI